MNDLNFTNEKYKDIALNIKKVENTPSKEEAFFLLINNVQYKDLDNLCKYIHKYYFDNDENVTLEDCYNLTQNIELELIDKEAILKIAYMCIEDGNYLGTNTINEGKINTSSWLSHSLNSSKLAIELSNILKIDNNAPATLGMLHDYGRKFDHTFSHTIKGFESLIDLGWNNAAIGCLTHSFLNGGRCANNEEARPGFFVDSNGNPQWNEHTKKDDIHKFLDNYNYTNDDLILNITDLMATDKGIVSPLERINDIATRRKIDPTNRGYFLSEFTNLLINFLKVLDPNNNYNYIKANKDTSLEEINSYFEHISNKFYEQYKNTITNNNSYVL